MSNLKWFLFLFLVFALSSALVGIAEMSYLGPHSGQAVLSPFFDMYGTTASGEGFNFVLLNPANWKGVLNAFYSMLIWKYAVLEYGIGAAVKYVLLWPLSLAFTFCLFLTLVSHIPIIGRGSN